MLWTVRLLSYFRRRGAYDDDDVVVACFCLNMCVVLFQHQDNGRMKICLLVNMCYCFVLRKYDSLVFCVNHFFSTFEVDYVEVFLRVSTFEVDYVFRHLKSTTFFDI